MKHSSPRPPLLSPASESLRTLMLWVASSNPHKVEEIRSIFHTATGGPWECRPLGNVGSVPEEPYETFVQNALHKARYYGGKWQELRVAESAEVPPGIRSMILSEDSGLCIEALAGFPGVHSQPFLATHRDLAEASRTLERMLAEGREPVLLAAYFHCAAVLYCPETAQWWQHEAQLKGVVTFPPRGKEGFAFDPIFVPKGYQQTLAELGSAIKRQISHRTAAVLGVVHAYGSDKTGG